MILIILLWVKWNITDRIMTSLLVANHPQDALINEQMSTRRSPVLGHKGLPCSPKEPYDLSVFFDILSRYMKT